MYSTIRNSGGGDTRTPANSNREREREIFFSTRWSSLSLSLFPRPRKVELASAAMSLPLSVEMVCCVPAAGCGRDVRAELVPRASHEFQERINLLYSKWDSMLPLSALLLQSRQEKHLSRCHWLRELLLYVQSHFFPIIPSSFYALRSNYRIKCSISI